MQHNYAAHNTRYRTTHRTTHRTQFAHNPAQYRYNNTHKPQHRCITYDLHKYSFDLYHEYIDIKNSNTIEIYTIFQDKI